VVNGVIENRLRDRPFLTGEYSIADMAAFPWIVSHTLQGQKLEEFPKLKVWFETIRSRPAVVRGLDVSKEKRGQPMSEEAKKILFGQTTAKVLAR
jgi:GSH-dependent disulfide-bond oxidoreductase